MDFHPLACMFVSPCSPHPSPRQHPSSHSVPLDLSTTNSGCTTTRRKSIHSPHTRYRITSNDAIVITPPDVVRTRASSTVLAKASSLVNRDLAGISFVPDNLGSQLVTHSLPIATKTQNRT